jgi:mono/diheme cytochrome c family protein
MRTGTNRGGSPLAPRPRAPWRTLLAGAALLGGLAACGENVFPEGGYDKLTYRQRNPLPAPVAPDPPPAVASLGPTGPAEVPALPAGAPAGVTQEMVASGQQLYGTICGACHGPAGTGTAAGPSLNDASWIHITGTYDELVTIITTGVPNPRQYPAAMPPRGGGPYTDEEIRAISAYVFALSHSPGS